MENIWQWQKKKVLARTHLISLSQVHTIDTLWYEKAKGLRICMPAKKLSFSASTFFLPSTLDKELPPLFHKVLLRTNIRCLDHSVTNNFEPLPHALCSHYLLTKMLSTKYSKWLPLPIPIKISTIYSFKKQIVLLSILS